MTQRPVALITGSSQGIGAATAIEFARRGYNTALAALDADGLNSTAEQVRQAGSEALVLSGDLFDLDFAQSTVDQTLARWGRIDALVNNAAWREVATMRTITVESWERTLRIGLTVPAFLARWVAASMEPQRHGVIINISSIQSQMVAGLSPAYCAAKGGLDSLTYELATLYGPVGIRVVGVNLGAIDSGMGDDYESAEGENISSEMRRASEDMIPLRRWATPSETARHIAWLASHDASYITGTSIVVDGGWSQQISPYSLKHRMFPEEF